MNSNPRCSFEALNSVVSVRCRKQNVSGEFCTKIHPPGLRLFRFPFAIPATPHGEFPAIVWLKMVSSLQLIFMGKLFSSDCAPCEQSLRTFSLTWRTIEELSSFCTDFCSRSLPDASLEPRLFNFQQARYWASPAALVLRTRAMKQTSLLQPHLPSSGSAKAQLLLKQSSSIVAQIPRRDNAR